MQQLQRSLAAESHCINSHQANWCQRWLRKNHPASTIKMAWIGLTLTLFLGRVTFVLAEKGAFQSHTIQERGKNEKCTLTVYWWNCRAIVILTDATYLTLCLGHCDYIQVGPEKNAQSLPCYYFWTVCPMIAMFTSKCAAESAVNWPIENICLVNKYSLLIGWK